MEPTNFTTNNSSSLSIVTDDQTHTIPFSYSEITPYTSHIRTKGNYQNKDLPSNHLSIPTINDCVIIWLDSNIDMSNEIHQNVITHLQQVINTVKTFTNVKSCLDFIITCENKKIFIVLSNKISQEVVNRIHNISYVKSIYVFCNDLSNDVPWIRQYSKVKRASSQIEHIGELLNIEIRRYDNHLSTISITDGPVLGLNELDQSFMYSQLLKEILLEMKDDDKQKEMHELIVLLRDKYANNKHELKSIDDFEQNYNDNSVINWYTKKYYIYSTLNQALRCQDINVIIKMGFLVRDLHRQIEQLHPKSVQATSQIVYRGQAISSADFEKMKKNKGGLLCFNNFLSTSTDLAVSIMYAESNQQQVNMIGIVFEIEINSSILSASYALLNDLTQFDDEKEILFSMNAVFRIGDIEEFEGQPPKVKLILTNDKDEQLQHVIDCFRKEIGEGTGWHQLGYLLIILDELDLAEKIYKKLLDITPSDRWCEVARLNNQLGIVNITRGDYSTALSFFQQTREIEEKYFAPDHLDLAVTYNNIAETYHSLIRYSDALSYHEKVLASRQKSLSPDDPLLAATHSNIGGVYLSMGKYKEAKSCFEKALKIGEKSLPSKHPDLSTIYDNLALVHILIGEYEEAITFYQKSHEIDQKSLPLNHTALLITHSNIAAAHDSMGNYSTALSLYEEMLDVQKRSRRPNHPVLGVLNNNIGLAYLEMGQFSKAFSYFQKALEIHNAINLPNNPELVTTHNNIGQYYLMKKDLAKALLYHERALKIEENYLPPDHPNLATTYNTLGEIYRQTEDYTNAFLFHGKALAIREKSLPSDHPSLATSYNNIGLYYQDIAEYETAIQFHQKAVDIYQKSPTPNYPKLAIVYSNIGKTYYSLKNYQKALSFFEKTCEIEEKWLGHDYPDLGYTYHNIAYALEGLRRYQEAFNYIRKAIDIATRTCEPDDPRLKLFQDHRDDFLLKVLYIIYKRHQASL